MNVCFDVYEAGIGREIRVHNVNQKFSVLIGTVIEGFTVPETVITK